MPLALLALGALSCSGGGGGEPTPVPRTEAGEPFAFARQIAARAELHLPPSSRPGGAASPERAPILGPFKQVRALDGVTTWEAPLPIRTRNLFFHKALAGMTLSDADGTLPFGDGLKGAKTSRTWDFTAKTVLIRRPSADGPPRPGAYEMAYPRAAEREDELNLATFVAAQDIAALRESAPVSLSDDDVDRILEGRFVARSLQLGEDTRTGLLLPAPARAAWDVVLPTNAALTLEATLLPPELDEGAASDGATLIIELERGGGVEVLAERALTEGEWLPIRIDLSSAAAAANGAEVRIRFRSEGGVSDLLDYVFLAEPTLYTPVESPERVVMVFIDTMRPDHMGLYGYERDTTPKLDAWAEGATIFEDARSIAPWTLPSARTAISGRQPELWRADLRLPELFAREGYATGAFVGNIYLSSNFEMSEGWSQHGCVNWPLAEVQVEKVEDFLARHPDRDALVMLHLMDMHLPYTEPPRYMNIWAGERPDGISERGASRKQVLSAVKKDESAKQYVIDRYDQNMRYIDDQLAALFERLGDNAKVVIFADHGEEFWDHGDFEHGHTVFDELLRVPMVVKAPGLPGGRVDAPVSLLDLTPTVLDLAGLEIPGSVVGRSLLPAIRSEGGAREVLEGRSHAFGRPLYGEDRWGVIDGDQKWSIHKGKEQVFHLAADPGEEKDLVNQVDLQPLRDAFWQRMSETNDPAPLLWRVSPSRKSSTRDLVVEFEHPAGFTDAWLGEDYLNQSSMELEHEEGGPVRVTFRAGFAGAREIYLQPVDPSAYDALTLTVIERGERGAPQLNEEAPGRSPNGRAQTLMRARAGGRSLQVTWAVSRRPVGEDLDATDAEMAAELEALGYIHREEE